MMHKKSYLTSLTQKHFAWLVVALLMAIAAFLRVHNANLFYYNPDEAMHTGIAAGQNLLQVWQFAHYEIHPPLLYILCHYWMMISTDPAFVRCLPLLFGLGMIPLYYSIGKTLNGEFTGLACAALITFSHGCIIQSYVVRQYMPFLFFLSLAFYCYLRWRVQHSPMALTAYAICATLACLTHFSGIFSVFCIAAYEGLELLKRREPQALLAAWAGINLCVGMAALYVYHLWQPILVPLKSFFATHVAGGFANQAVHALFFPIAASGYALPGYYTAALLFLLGEAGAFAALPRLAGLRALLRLNLLAYGLGMLLVITRIYPEPGTRHSLWILPFVIAPAGWMVALLLEWLVRKLLPSSAKLHALTGSLILLIGCLLSYNQQERFDDGSEYVWQQDVWRNFSNYMERLGPTDLIVTEKDDGIMLANLYPSMQDALTGASMTAITPYARTRILFNPYYPRNYSTDVFLATLREAQAKHLLDSAETLVFLRMAWSRSPLTYLMRCDALTKQVITFPAFDHPSDPSLDDIERARAAVMLVSKQIFVKDVLSPQGKARACLDGRHDMVPGFKASILQ